jgi:hypothetical protein
MVVRWGNRLEGQGKIRARVGISLVLDRSFWIGVNTAKLTRAARVLLSLVLDDRGEGAFCLYKGGKI